MILIGQYDSPFVRRVGIALGTYGLAFEHRPWSVWGDAEKIAAHNPLRRVPTLLLDDGTALVETFAILDTIDELVPAQRALLPRSGPARRDGESGVGAVRLTRSPQTAMRPPPIRLGTPPRVAFTA